MSARREVAMPARALTANRLVDGRVVYLTPAGGWSEAPEAAAWAEDEAGQQELLHRGREQAGASVVVEPYLIDVRVDDGGRPRPTRNREVIRSLGPSVRRDLGRQAALKG